MELNLFLEPISHEESGSDKSAHRRFTDVLRVNSLSSSFPDLSDIKLAIIGVNEDRRAISNRGCANGPDKVREQLYQLFYHWNDLKIADLGNIRQGHSMDDTYFALTQTCSQLIQQGIIPIIIGGSQDLTFANYRAYENIGQLVNLVSVDPCFDLGDNEDELHSRSYLSKIILHQPNYLFNFTNLGYQSYYIDKEALELMDNLFFDVYRLGNIQASPEEAEPVVRNADILSFDITSIRSADAPGNANAGPNGFGGNEACRICRYAGMSDKLSSVGFYEYNPSFDNNNVTAQLLAQMIWYFIDGYARRNNDLPQPGSKNFARYTVRIEGQEDEVVFLRSKKTGRWWIDLSFGRNDRKKYEKHHYVPCSKRDYELALHDDIPDRWWQFYQKLM
jgi:arginase family enzyme